MCGILGIVANEGIKYSKDEFKVSLDLLKSRGPDSEGIYFQEKVALGSRRLSILDISDNGDQPFFSHDKNIILIFNGLIYNYLELRNRLKDLGYKFKSNTDTEVVLASYIIYGLNFTSYLRGMWSIAIWDSSKSKLILSRDRLGVKPLYYYRENNTIIFSSEIKSIINLAPLASSIDDQRVVRYLSRGWADDSLQSFFDKISIVSPAQNLIIENDSINSYFYWELKDSKDNLTDIDDLRSTLIDTVSIHTRADVKSGVALSGGIDSSGLASIINILKKNKDLTAFTIAPPQTSDESVIAQQIANDLEINLVNIDVTNVNIAEAINEVILLNDEPINSINTVYQYIMRRSIKDHGITVLLTGEGADEVFAGYDKFFLSYLLTLKQNNQIDIFESSIKDRAINLEISEYKIRSDFDKFCRFYLTNRHIQFNEVSRGLLNKSFEQYLEQMNKEGYLYNNGKSPVAKSIFKTPLFHDLATHLFNRFIPLILRMEDRISSGCSLESRVPYLDHILIEKAWSYSANMFMKRGKNKYLLREALNGISPKYVLNKNKKLRKPGSNSYIAYKQIPDLIQDVLSTYSHSKYFSSDLVSKFREDMKENNEPRAFLWMRIYFFGIWQDNLDLL